MAFSVKGKTAIVTGAGSGKNYMHGIALSLRQSTNRLFIITEGINFSFAQLLLQNGCNCVIADLALRPEAQVVVDKHSAKSGSAARAVFQKTDVTDWAQLERMFEVAEREFGEIDIVCPGAGVYEPVSAPDVYLHEDGFSNYFAISPFRTFGILQVHPNLAIHQTGQDMPIWTST